MSLCLWLPLNGNFENQGTVAIPPISMSNIEWPTGKLCSKCLYIKGTSSNTVTVPELIGKEEFSISIWWRLNESDIPTAKNYTRFFAVYMDTDGVESVYRIEHCNNTTQPGAAQSLFPRSEVNFSPIYRGFGGHTGNIYQWNHEVVCVDKSTAKWYLNGVCILSIPVSEIYKDYMHLTGKISFGQAGSMVQLQDFRIYDHCLSPKEVKEISKGLILHYPLSSPYEEPVKNIYGNQYENGYGGSRTEVIKTLKTDEHGNPYTNYSFSKSPGTVNTWYSIYFNTYPFIAGKFYTIAVDVRVNDCNNCSMEIRHSRLNNDYYGCKTVLAVAGSKVGLGWRTYTLTQSIPASFVYNSETKVCNPLIELYTGNLANSEDDSTTIRSADFDIRNVQVIEKDHYLPYSSGNRDGTVFDCSGFNNNGVMESSSCPSWNSESVKYNGCYQFSGNHFIKFPLPYSDKKIYECTIAFWVNLTASTAYQAILIPYGNPSGGLWLSLNTENCSLWAYQGKNDPRYHTVVGEYFPKNRWIHVTFSFNNGVSKYYLDGKYQNSITWTLPYIQLTDYFSLGDSYSGDSWNGTPFNGKLSDFRIYATALSDVDIADLYNIRASITDNGILMAAGEVLEEC